MTTPTTAIFLVPVELIAIVFIIYKVRRRTRKNKSSSGNDDFVENLRNSLYQTLGKKRVTEIFATEISVFYYGFFGWTTEVETANGKAFTYYKRSGYSAIVGIFFFLIVMETFFLHLLIMRWSVTAAWVLTILSIYGTLFFLGDFNAARKRPIIAGDKYLQIRIAFRWAVAIPYENIERIEMKVGMRSRDKKYLRLVLIGSENMVLSLKEPMTAKGLYGISRTFKQCILSIDQKDEFYALIKEKMSETEQAIPVVTSGNNA